MDLTNFEYSLKSEDESVEVFEIQEVDSPFGNEEIISESRTKCGDVFMDAEQMFTLVCGTCKNEYTSLDLFGKHVVSKHVASSSVDNSSFASDLEQFEILEDKDELLNSQCVKLEVALATKEGSKKKLKADENRNKKQLQSRTYDVEPIFLCTVCGRKFSKKEKLIAHIDNDHNQASMVNESEKNNVGEGRLQDGKDPACIVLTSKLAQTKGRSPKFPRYTYAKNRSQTSLSVSNIGMLDEHAETDDDFDECDRSFSSRQIYIRHAKEKQGISIKKTNTSRENPDESSSKSLDTVSRQSKFVVGEENDWLLELNNVITPGTPQITVLSKTSDNDFVGEEEFQSRNVLSCKSVKKLSERKDEATSEILETPETDNIVIVSEGQEIVAVHEDSVKPPDKNQLSLESDSEVDQEDEFFKVEPAQAKQNPRAVKKIYSCSKCGQIYKLYRSYQTHVKQNNCNKKPTRRKRRIPTGPMLVIEKKPKAPEPLTCEYCQEKFDAKNLLEEHTRLTHRILLSKRLVKRECRFCGEVCAGKRGLEEHSRKAHPDKELDVCEYCGKRFNRPRVLREHLNVHLGIKPYQCPHCPTAFVSQSNLVNHIRVHLQIKNYKCTYCDKRFVTSTDKKIHELSHTGEKNHQCSECGKLFPTPTRLNDHMRRHLNIKNFKCQVCDRAFYSSALLGNHRLTHSEPRYECHLCGKRVKRMTTLRNHMNLHGDEKYSCPVCKEAFPNFSTLRAHHKTHKETDDMI